jgi:primosomal protein N' (replication factor Y)
LLQRAAQGARHGTVGCKLSATPAHSATAGLLTYRSAAPLPAGTPRSLGRREVLAWWMCSPKAAILPEDKDYTLPLDGWHRFFATWRRLVVFTAGYYQRSLGGGAGGPARRRRA